MGGRYNGNVLIIFNYVQEERKMAQERNGEGCKELIFINPVFKEMIWGGNRLRTDWGYEIPGDDTGECWAVSAHPNGDCTVKGGSFDGKKLSRLWEEEPEIFGGNTAGKFPLLIKIIDAKADLSIQVHPDDAYAAAHENGSLGKTECWYILDCEENAHLVVGHNARTREELKEMIGQKRWKELIREVPVHKGDFIQIDPGTVHAIKGGIQLLETQQNSDITYRVYDYDRLQNGKPRQLHVEKSIDVIKVPAASVEDSIHSMDKLPVNALNEMISCDYYKVFKLTVEQEYTLQQSFNFLIVSVIDGSAKLTGKENGYEAQIKKGDHFLIPSGFGEIELCGNATLIASTPVQKG